MRDPRLARMHDRVGVDQVHFFVVSRQEQGVVGPVVLFARKYAHFQLETLCSPAFPGFTTDQFLHFILVRFVLVLYQRIILNSVSQRFYCALCTGSMRQHNTSLARSQDSSSRTASHHARACRHSATVPR